MQPFTWNADQAVLPNGRKQTRFGVKWRNFREANGSWRGIDVRPAQVGNLLQIASAPYKLEAPLTADGDFRFDATVRWDIHRKAVIGSNPAGVTKRFPGALDVPAVVEGYLIRYPMAMPSIGADIVIRPHEQKVNFLYEWQQVPPGAGQFVECPIEFAGDVQPESVGQVRTIDTRDALTSKPVTFQANSNRGVTIKPAKVWDSLGRSAPVQLRLRRSGNTLIGVKLVPRAFLVAAFADGAAWVRSDTTSTFYPDANAESTSVDGRTLYGSAGATWATARAAAATSAADTDSSGTTFCHVGTGGTTDQYTAMTRAHILFDTSAIGSDVVSSGTFSLWGTTSVVGSPLSDEHGLCASAPASNTAIVTGDHELMGSTPFSDSYFAQGSWSTSGYNDLTLNAAGIAAVATGGITKYGVRQREDLTNTTPTWGLGKTAVIVGYYADRTGTDNDPKLVVEHAAAASGGQKNRTLLGAG